jgi:hypothetical protein
MYLIYSVNFLLFTTLLAPIDKPLLFFKCITGEAKLMSKVLTKCILEDDKASAELLQGKVEVCNEVRKAAFDILTTYRGPYSMQVSASMLVCSCLYQSSVVHFSCSYS